MNEFVTKQIVAAQALVAKLRKRAEEGQGPVEYFLRGMLEGALILALGTILLIVALNGHAGR
jgi:uncharacterized membrane protein (DUF4010 family)